MIRMVQRTVACATAFTAALAVVGVTSASSEAVGSERKAARYAAIVQEDPTASLDGNGDLYYTEPVPTAAAVRARTAVPALAPQFPLSQTFQLHSQPGSNRTILLDFDGASVSGTAWNTQNGLPNGSHPAWTLDGNASTFNNNERTLIQEIWQRVAEDFAPYDVDVTTEDPGTAGIVRSSSGDQVFGARALISPSNAVDKLCDGECVGLAYLDVFDEVGGSSQPVWVFPQFYEDNAKGIAETVSHEVGHNLNLKHDGNSKEDYDSGHSPWAAIMGNSDNEPISQWSKGDYTDADNQQDDFAVMAAAGLSFRADEAGNSIGAATARAEGTAYITSRSDKDFWALGQCSGSVKVTATGAAVGTNLDIELRLYSALGVQVAVNNPASAKVNADVASGMNATVSTPVAVGQYVAAVDGVGNGTPKTGYDDYASVGAYTLTVTGCDGSVDPGGETPSAPQNLAVAPDPSGTSALVSWAAPADTGESPVTGYEVTVGGVTDSVSAATFSYQATGLGRGETYDVSVVAVNDAGAGAPATATLTMADVPGPPTVTGAGNGAFGGKITASVRWAPPTDDGGSAITGYVIKATRWSLLGRALWTGTTPTPLSADQRSATLELIKPGIWSFRVQAINEIGAGAFSKASKKVRGR